MVSSLATPRTGRIDRTEHPLVSWIFAHFAKGCARAVNAGMPKLLKVLLLTVIAYYEARVSQNSERK